MNIALSAAQPVKFSIEILQCLTAIFAESMFVRVADPLVLVTNAKISFCDDCKGFNDDTCCEKCIIDAQICEHK